MCFVGIRCFGNTSCSSRAALIGMHVYFHCALHSFPFIFLSHASLVAIHFHSSSFQCAFMSSHLPLWKCYPSAGSWGPCFFGIPGRPWDAIDDLLRSQLLKPWPSRNDVSFPSNAGSQTIVMWLSTRGYFHEISNKSHSITIKSYQITHKSY